MHREANSEYPQVREPLHVESTSHMSHDLTANLFAWVSMSQHQHQSAQSSKSVLDYIDGLSKRENLFKATKRMQNKQKRPGCLGSDGHGMQFLRKYASKCSPANFIKAQTWMAVINIVHAEWTPESINISCPFLPLLFIACRNHCNHARYCKQDAYTLLDQCHLKALSTACRSMAMETNQSGSRCQRTRGRSVLTQFTKLGRRGGGSVEHNRPKRHVTPKSVCETRDKTCRSCHASRRCRGLRAGSMTFYFWWIPQITIF